MIPIVVAILKWEKELEIQNQSRMQNRNEAAVIKPKHPSRRINLQRTLHRNQYEQRCKCSSPYVVEE